MGTAAEMSPEIMAWRLGRCVLLGATVGLMSDLTAPLRRRAAFLADGIWGLWILGIWLTVSFSVCRGDVRLGYSAAAFAGALGWRWSVSSLLRPVFFRLWERAERFFLLPVKLSKILLKKTKNFRKKLFPTGRKWVTIRKDKMPQ